MSSDPDHQNDDFDQWETRRDDGLEYDSTHKGFQQGQKVFGRYTLIRELGRGGMGVVWLARDERLRREVALKFLPEAVMGDAVALDDLREETNRCLELTHSNIMRIHDLVEDQHAAAIVMEYVEGASLSELRLNRSNKVFEVSEITAWIEQVCVALEYAHTEAKIVHRDIKPANVMIDESTGRVKLADFGISRSLSDTMTRNTRSDAAGSWKGGTLVYMSPQHLMGHPPTVSDDIYALGATIYVLLTGKPPFYRGNVQHQIETQEATAMTERRREFGIEKVGKIPRVWEQAVEACLAKDAEDRPQSVAALWQELSGEVVIKRKKKAPVKKSGGSGKVLALAAGMLLAASAAAGWWYGVEVPKRAVAEQAKLAAQQEVERKAQKTQAAEAKRKEQVAALYESIAGTGADDLKKKAIYEQVLKLEPGSAQALRGLGRLDALRTSVQVNTVPEGAQFILNVSAGEQEGEEVGKGSSPVKIEGLALGIYTVQIEMEGFEAEQRELSVLNGEGQKMDVQLKRSVGSLAIESTPAAMVYELQRLSSAVADYDGAFVVRKGVTPEVVGDLPTGKYEVVMKREGWADYRKEYVVGREVETVVAWEFAEGKVRLESIPTGAEVREEGKLLGVTPLELVLPVGEHGMSLSLAKYQDLEAKFKVKTGSGVERLVLKNIPYPVSGENYVNSLGVKMVPTGTKGVLFSVYEARVKDFREFVEATGYNAIGGATSLESDGNNEAGASWKDPHFPITEDHCVTCVSWDDAKAFCKWLTEKERKAGLIAAGQEYRLPTDVEWSAAVGLAVESGSTPKERAEKNEGKYPWGDDWPPKKGDEGNFKGEEAYWGAFKSNKYTFTWIKGYTDAHPRTAPVASYRVNEYGLYDMGGNVAELCEDWYDSDQKRRVTRGGSWASGQEYKLLSSCRLIVIPTSRLVIAGFRVVLDVGVNAAVEAEMKSPLELGAVSKESPYVNSLGVKMVPAGTKGVLFSEYETRVKDFREFVEATGYNAIGEGISLESNGYAKVGASWKDPRFPITEDHCVTCVSWDDAQAFCKWLTEKERKAGLIAAGQEYRLPTDVEWSAAVGLAVESGSTPKERDGKIESKYSWGDDWPPKKGDEGNYMGKEGYWGGLKAGRWKNESVEGGYTDSHPRTAPVASYRANEYGLYDMGGNVNEWCEDWYSSDRKKRVSRGASWHSSKESSLCSSNRIPGNITTERRIVFFGFRVVLDVGGGNNAAVEVEMKSPLVLEAVSKESPYVNSLGVKMVPAGTKGVLFSVYETRVKDFREFVEATGYNAIGGAISLESNGLVKAGASWKGPHFPITEDHCVTCVNWDDAQAFCKWLTEKERKAGLIAAGQEYRLPTDLEWSAAVGLEVESGSTPAERFNLTKHPNKNDGKYPWGDYWPPKKGDEGNYLGKEAHWGAIKTDKFRSIEGGYTDAHPRTAPVASYRANEYGLYDMGGNVWEWCEDWVSSDRIDRTQRGGAWGSQTMLAHLSYSRLGDSPKSRSVRDGFRVVLDVGVGG